MSTGPAVVSPTETDSAASGSVAEATATTNGTTPFAGNLGAPSPSASSSPGIIDTNSAPAPTTEPAEPTTPVAPTTEPAEPTTPVAPTTESAEPTTPVAPTTEPAEPTTLAATPTGSLSITAPEDPVNLGSGTPTVANGTISGTLGEVQVTDTREAGTAAGWVASVSTAGFTASAGLSIPASALSYDAGGITGPGTAIYIPNDPDQLSGAATSVVAAIEITGPNNASWNPTITLTIPAGTLAGEYSAIITHSVL